MNHTVASPQDQPLSVGDRVSIRRDRWPLIGQEDQVGTVVEVFRVPRDSCLVRVDGDTKRDREWFFYRVEVTPDECVETDCGARNFGGAP